MENHQLLGDEIQAWCSIKADELLDRSDLRARPEVLDTADEALAHAGDMMADEVAANNRAGKRTVWVLPAGPMKPYDRFVERVNSEQISLANLWIFHMDEFLDWEGRPYPVGDTYESLEGTMIAGFYDRVDPELRVPEEQRIWPRIDDLDAPDRLCAELGGVDTVWAGVSHNGAVAFCVPPRDHWIRISVDQYLASKTHTLSLPEDTIVALAHRTFGSCYDRVPPKAVTIGYQVMASARRIVYMICTGPQWKSTVARILLQAPPSLDYPVTVLNAAIPERIMITDANTIDHPMSHQVKGW